MRSFLKDLSENRFALQQLILRDFKLKYTGSILGLSWALINPLIIMFVVSFVFTKIFKVDFINFPIFVLSAMFPWMWFSVTVHESAFTLLKQSDLFRQFNVRKEFFVISCVAANFLNFMIGWCLVLPVFFFFQPKALILSPVLLFVVIMQLLFSFGLGLILSSSTVILRDIGKLLEVVLLFWFWITPIFYSVDMVPEKWSWIIMANPMALFIDIYRGVLFYGRMPHFVDLFMIIVWAAVFLLVGFKVFGSLESKVLKRI